MADREIASGVETSSGTTYDLGPQTPVSGVVSYIVFGPADRPSANMPVTGVVGTNGWNVTWHEVVASAGVDTNCGVSIFWCIPSSSVAGTITPTFTGTVGRMGWMLRDNDEADVTTPFPSTVVEAYAVGSASSSVTHGTMADAVNNTLLCATVTDEDDAPDYAGDANYTDADSTPLRIGASAMLAVQSAVGGSNLTCAMTWDDATSNYHSVIVEIAKAAGGATDGEVSEAASARIMLPSEVAEGASFRIAQLGEVPAAASLRTALPSEVYEAGSVTISLPGEIAEASSLRISMPGEVAEAASARVALPSEINEAASLRASLPSELSDLGSVRISMPGEVASTASVSIGNRGELSEVGSVRIGLPGEISEAVSVRILVPAEISEAASARVSLLSEQDVPASVRVALQGQINELASARVALVSESTSAASFNISLPTGDIATIEGDVVLLPAVDSDTELLQAVTGPTSLLPAVDGSAEILEVEV